MNILTKSLLLVFVSIVLSEHTNFYNQPGYRFYYGYHPYKYRSLEYLVRRSFNETIAEKIDLVFNGTQFKPVMCSFNTTDKHLKCSGPISDISCTSSIDFLNLQNVYFQTYGLGKIVLSDFGISTGFVKYQANPFERKSVNQTTIVYEYSIPIYGNGLDIYVNVTDVDSNKETPKLLDENEYFCFNTLISLLNESKFFYNLKVVSNAVNEAFKDLVF